MKMLRQSLPVIICAAIMLAGCQSIDTSIFGGPFGRNSSAMTAGGAVAGQDYVIGLKPSEAAQQYFASASASDAKPVTVTPGDDKGTGVTWTDDGGITIPPGTTIEFTNKGCCLDPHLPAPKADEEMQFIKTSCLIPTQLQGTYKNLLRRAAAGDEDVKSNLQHLMWTLRTAGSNDAYAKNLTDRQREILAECAEAGSFDGYCQDLQRFDGLKKLVMAQVGQVADKLQVEIGNVTYKVTDLLDPELGKQKVAAHLGELIHMNEYLPVAHSGFNFGELQKGIYTDIKGNGTLSFKAKVANSTSEPFVFYPMDYVAQVGSGQNMQGAFFAAADNTMRQRATMTVPSSMDASGYPLEGDLPENANITSPIFPVPSRETTPFPDERSQELADLEQELARINNQLGGTPEWLVMSSFAILNIFELAKEGVSYIPKGGSYIASGMDAAVEGMRHSDKEWSSDDVKRIGGYALDIGTSEILRRNAVTARNKMNQEMQMIQNELGAGVINKWQAKSRELQAVGRLYQAESTKKIVDGSTKVVTGYQTVSTISENLKKQEQVKALYNRKRSLEKEIQQKKQAIRAAEQNLQN